VLLEAEGPARTAAVAALLPGVRACDASPQAAIRYLVDPPPLPSREPDRAYDDIRIWDGHDEVFLQFASDVRANVTDREAHIGGGRDHLDVAFARLFHPAAAHLLAGYGRFVLHAAAIARPSSAFLVLGSTGTGKSTLALAALHGGWQLLGDDLAVLRQGADGLEVSAIARRTALPGDLGAHGVAGIRPLPGDHRSRWELPPDQLAHGWFALAGVLLSGHSHHPAGELSQCGPQTVFDTALASFTALTSPPRLRRFLPCAAALARLPAWNLRLGADPTIRLTTAAQLLEQAASIAADRPARP
jgi:hypothetical protein